MPAVLTLLIAFAGGGAGAALVTQIFTRRNSAAEAVKTHAEAGQVVTAAAEALVKMMQTQLDAAQAEVKELRGEVYDLTKQVAALSAEVAFYKGKLSVPESVGPVARQLDAEQTDQDPEH